MNTKHTPGPWDNPTFSCAPYSVWKGDTQIASCRWVEDDSEEISVVCVQSDAEARANATLIAAAPELLACAMRSAAALRSAGIEPDAHSDNQLCWLLHQTEAAIAKAMGEQA